MTALRLAEDRMAAANNKKPWRQRAHEALTHSLCARRWLSFWRIIKDDRRDSRTCTTSGKVLIGRQDLTQHTQAVSSIISTTPYYTSNVTTALTFNLPSCDSVRPAHKTKSSFTDTLCFASDSKRPLKSKFSPLLIISVYYRIYAEDGAIPSKTPITPDDPFLGCIDAISVPPPHTIKVVKHSIAKVENIKNRTSTSLFVTQSIADGRRWKGNCSQWYRLRIHAAGTPSPRRKDVRLRTKRLGVRKERWTCECWRLGPWCNTSRDSISYVHDSTLFLFSFRNILIVWESVLSPICRPLLSSFESSHWSKETLPWSYPGWCCCAAP